MKAVFLIALTILAFSCRGQSKFHSYTDLPEELFQRWMLSYGMASGQKIDGLPQSPLNDYELKKDNTYILYSDEGSKMVGTWEYNKDEKRIYKKRDDGGLNGKFSDIKPVSITLIPAGGAVEGTPFENFRFYHVPKKE